jgi:hypothetical protein
LHRAALSPGQHDTRRAGIAVEVKVHAAQQLVEVCAVDHRHVAVQVPREVEHGRRRVRVLEFLCVWGEAHDGAHHGAAGHERARADHNIGLES